MKKRRNSVNLPKVIHVLQPGIKKQPVRGRKDMGGGESKRVFSLPGRTGRHDLEQNVTSDQLFLLEVANL